MQNLDEFKVRNFVKRVLGRHRENQEQLIYAFNQKTEKQETKQESQQRQEEEEEENIFSDDEETKSHEASSETVQKPVTAPMPGSNFSFEDEIETALQNYIQVEHAGNILMPTINFQASTLKETQFLHYIKHDELFKFLYSCEESDEEQAGEVSFERTQSNTTELAPQKIVDSKVDLRQSTQSMKSIKQESLSNLTGGASPVVSSQQTQQLPSQQPQSQQQQMPQEEEKVVPVPPKPKRKAQPTSLMLVSSSDSRAEKLELKEKRRRKVYSDQETGYELQDLFRINDGKSANDKHPMMAFGRATHREVMQTSKLRVFLQPQVYPRISFEERILHKGSGVTQSDIRTYLKNFTGFFMNNPYATAKLFHGIATDAFNPDNYVEDRDQRADWREYYDDIDEMNTKVTWGSFLPDRVRQLLLNISRYYLDNILAADSLDQNLATEKFFAAIKIFIQNTRKADLFQSRSPLKVHWHFLQVLKVLYEGQARSSPSLTSLKKIFKPVYHSIGAPQLRKHLTSLTEENKEFLSQQYSDEQDNMVDKFRSKLFDSNPNYSFCKVNANRRNRSSEISMSALALDKNDDKQSMFSTDDRINFHDAKMPTEISHYFFRSLSRVMPEPALVFEESMLEPLTSVFADFQNQYNKQNFDADPNLKTLPDCKRFTFEVVSTNMLMVDIYAPEGLIEYEPRAALDDYVEQVSPERNASVVRQIMTAKVIQICSTILDRLTLMKHEIPLRLKLFIKLLLSHGKEEGQDEITQDDAHLIADFLGGSWLSNAFRWPECLGMEPVFKEEALTLGHLLTASRLVLETCLACQVLPYPVNGHATYNIKELNTFILEQKSKVLTLYNSVFSTVSPNQISEPDYKVKQKENPTKPYPPKEIIEAQLLRVSDLATLIKLVQWQIQANWAVFTKYELQFQFNDDKQFMVHANPPEVVKQRVQHAKERLKTISKSSVGWKLLTGIVNFWEQKSNFTKYQEFYSKPTAPYSFDLEWCHISYNYKSDLAAKVMQILLKSKTSMQDPLFRIYKQLGSQTEKRPLLQFRDEIFEDQYISLFSSQKFETFKNNIKEEKTTNQNKQLHDFVEQHYDPNASHYRLKEPSKTSTKRSNQKGTDLSIIHEDQSENSRYEDGTDTQSEYTDFDTESEVSSYAGSPLNRNGLSQSERVYTNVQGLSGSANGPTDGSEDRGLRKMASQVSSVPVNQQPSLSLSAGETKDEVMKQHKSQYVDAIVRVFYHLRGALNEPNFLTEKIKQRMHMARMCAEEEMNGELDAAQEDALLNLEDLFKRVLEDDREQPDQSMKLQLDAFLIKRYFSKLDESMQKNLMELLHKRTQFVNKMMDLNFERQNYKYDRVLKFIKNMQGVTARRLRSLEQVYRSLKVNRFICKNWQVKLTVGKEDINSMIRNFYQAEAQQMRNLHHQTEILQESKGDHKLSTMHLSTLSESPEKQRRRTLKTFRESISRSVLTDFIEEQSQLDRINEDDLNKSIDSGYSSVMHVTQKQSLLHQKTEMTGSFLVIEKNQVTLDINLLSSNLIHVTTVTNYDFIKRKIREVDLEGLFMLSAMIDSTDDFFLISDLYKIYLFCVKRVLVEPNMLSEAVNENQLDFLGKVQDVFFQQLIQRLWQQLSSDDDLLLRDRQIRDYFRRQKGAENYKQDRVETDMDALDLSSDEEEEEEETSSLNRDIYSISINVMLQINETIHIEEKAAIVERSILTAMRAYKQSNMVDKPRQNVSSEALNRIIKHVVGECYLRDPDFTLHLNLTFIVMILTRRDTCPSCIQSVCKYLGTICHSIDDSAFGLGTFN